MDDNDLPPGPDSRLQSVNFLSDRTSNWEGGFSWSKHGVPHVITQYAHTQITIFSHEDTYSHPPRSDSTC
jgi:hypothetical protein